MKFLNIALTSFLFALVNLGNVANAGLIVDFESEVRSFCETGDFDSGGLNFSNDGNYHCYYTPSVPVDFPTALTSSTIGFGFSDVTLSATNGGIFSLDSLDLAFGPFNHGGLISDTTEVIGQLAGGGTISTVLTVGFGFNSHILNWNNLTAVTFSELQNNSQYLAFDNIAYDTAAVPEPSTLAIFALGILGLASRRFKKQS